MARKKQYTRPKVPRSNIRERGVRRAAPQPEAATAGATATATATATVGGAVRASRPARYVPEPPSLAEQYAHVRKDLVRITVFGTLIFGIMFALKFIGI